MRCSQEPCTTLRTFLILSSDLSQLHWLLLFLWFPPLDGARHEGLSSLSLFYSLYCKGKVPRGRAGALKMGLAGENKSPGVLQVCSVLVLSGVPQKWRLMRKGRDAVKIEVLLFRGWAERPDPQRSAHEFPAPCTSKGARAKQPENTGGRAFCSGDTVTNDPLKAEIRKMPCVSLYGPGPTNSPRGLSGALRHSADDLFSTETGSARVRRFRLTTGMGKCFTQSPN